MVLILQTIYVVAFPYQPFGLLFLEPLSILFVCAILLITAIIHHDARGRAMFWLALFLCFVRIFTEVLSSSTSLVYDDAFMFARYAHNVIVHNAITWNPGQPPVYGLTSPAY